MRDNSRNKYISTIKFHTLFYLYIYIIGSPPFSSRYYKLRGKHNVPCSGYKSYFFFCFNIILLALWFFKLNENYDEIIREVKNIKRINKIYLECRCFINSLPLFIVGKYLYHCCTSRATSFTQCIHAYADLYMKFEWER